MKELLKKQNNLNYLVLDVETTISNNGDPFDPRNKLCYVGLLDNTGTTLYSIEYDESPYGDKLREIKERISNADVIVGFNLKFDLHWLRRYIHDVDYSNCSMWDTQLVEFILSSQRLRFPSLDQVCNFYSLGSKLDVVATEYWENGIDTIHVPRSLLEDYLARDLELTRSLWQKQAELLLEESPQLRNLVWLNNEDLKVLQEMEFNGMKVNLTAIKEEQERNQKELDLLDVKLFEILKLPKDVSINISSTQQLSAIIYGGYINYVGTRIKQKQLKDGTIKETEVKAIKYYKLPGFAVPIKNSETEVTRSISNLELLHKQEKAKEEFKAIPYRKYSVDEAHLKMIHPRTNQGKVFINFLLQRAYIEQTLTTYLNKIPEMIADRHWKDDMIHGQFNQCVAKTGRLSSSKPNLQNLDTNLHHLFISRYAS
jgi:DNA polymerase I-like protein with 3'-5' exonuclease and polymerase domains